MLAPHTPGFTAVQQDMGGEDRANTIRIAHIVVAVDIAIGVDIPSTSSENQNKTNHAFCRRLPYNNVIYFVTPSPITFPLGSQNVTAGTNNVEQYLFWES